MKQEIRHLNNGRIVIEERADNMGDSYQDCWDYTELQMQGLEVGNQGCLGTREYIGPNRHGMANGQFLGVFLHDDQNGIPGNSNHTIKRLHGWRGTTNDVSIEGHGWRKVVESRPLTRGHGWRVVFSKEVI